MTEPTYTITQAEMNTLLCSRLEDDAANLLRSLTPWARPVFGKPGTRDVDVAAAQAALDATHPAPSTNPASTNAVIGQLVGALGKAQKQLHLLSVHMQCDGEGNGPDCTEYFQAQIDCEVALTAGRAALAQPCKYNQAAETCTLAPMDCQCAIDAALTHPQASEPAPESGEHAFLRGRSNVALQCLPDAPYRTMLAQLHSDMLAACDKPAPASGERDEVMARLQNTPRLDDVHALVDLMEAAKAAANMLAADAQLEAELDGERKSRCEAWAKSEEAWRLVQSLQAQQVVFTEHTNPVHHSVSPKQEHLRDVVEHCRAVNAALNLWTASAQRGDEPSPCPVSFAQQVAVPQGWKLVPLVATELMRELVVQSFYDELLAAAPQPPQAATPKPCTWTEDADGYYSTECGECFAFNEGTPAQNKAYFCHHCGGKIEVAA